MVNKNIFLYYMNYCINNTPPCCDSSEDGTDCHFLQETIRSENKYYMMNEEHQAYKDYEYDIYYSVKYDNNKYRRDMNVEGIRNGLLLYKMRMQWMHKYIRPDCYTCDNSSRDHQGNCNALWNALRYSLYTAFRNNTIDSRDLDLSDYNHQNYLSLNDVDDILIDMQPYQEVIDDTVNDMIKWKRDDRVSSTKFQVRKTRPPPRPREWPSDNNNDDNNDDNNNDDGDDGDDDYDDDEEEDDDDDAEYYDDDDQMDDDGQMDNNNYGGGSIKKGTRRGGKTRCVKKHNCKNKTKRKTRCVKKHNCKNKTKRKTRCVKKHKK